MRCLALIWICASLIQTTALGQCPNSDSLLQEIIFLRDSSSLRPAEQLPILLHYKDRIKSCIQIKDSIHVLLLRRTAAVYFALGDFAQAVQNERASISILSRNISKPSVNPNQLPGCYYWLSRFYDSLNKFDEKMIALDSCTSTALRLKSIDLASLWAIYSRIEYYFNVGDYERCINYATECESLANEYAKSADPGAAVYGLGYVASSLDWQVNAWKLLKNYAAEEKLLSNMVKEYQHNGLKNHLGFIYEELGKDQALKGNANKALYYFFQALAIYRQSGSVNDCRPILNDIGFDVYFKYLHNTDKALHYCKKAIYEVSTNQKPTDLDSMQSLNFLDCVAEIFVEKGLYDSAFRYFQFAFDQIAPGIDESIILHSPTVEFVQHPKVYYLWNLIIDKGDAFLKEFKSTKSTKCLVQAIRIYKITDQVLGRIKAEQTDPRSKLFWRNDCLSLYEHAIEACFLLGNTVEAFYFFEKSRAVLLNDQLNEQRWMGDADIRAQTELKEKVLALEKEAASIDKTYPRFVDLQNNIFYFRRELDRLSQTIKNKNPLYYQSQIDSSVITIEQVREKILNDHQGLLELFVGDSSVYSLLITPTRVYFNQINPVDFDSTVSAYTTIISNPLLLNRNFSQYITTANHLYHILFQLARVPAGRIVISPGGRNFPFESLVVSTNPEPVYFLANHAVSYTYSARYLVQDFSLHEPEQASSFLGVAPVQYPIVFSLPSLPESKTSVEKIGSNFRQGSTLTGRDATKNNFLNEFYKYRVLQLYTHSADSSINNEPVIYFADSALFLSELFTRNKPLTRLIVLSACETGSGKVYRGEGVFSFNRGFASLGIPSSISNLWAVDSKATYQLTELFYTYLTAGEPIDVALQHAKLKFIGSSSDEDFLPYYWASTIVAGRTDRIYDKKPQAWKYVAIFLVLVGFFLFGIKKWRGTKVRTDHHHLQL